MRGRCNGQAGLTCPYGAQRLAGNRAADDDGLAEELGPLVQHVEVEQPHQAGEYLAYPGLDALIGAGIHGVEADCLDTEMAGDEDGALVVKGLRDHGEVGLAEHLLGPHDGVQSPKTSVVAIDGAGRNAGLDQGSPHLAWFVVLHSGVVAGDQDVVHLAVVVELGGGLDPVLEVVVRAAANQVFGGAEHQGDPVIGHRIDVVVGVVTGVRDGPLAVAKQGGGRGQQQAEAGEQDLGKLLHARCGSGLK